MAKAFDPMTEAQGIAQGFVDSGNKDWVPLANEILGAFTRLRVSLEELDFGGLVLPPQIDTQIITLSLGDYEALLAALNEEPRRNAGLVELLKSNSPWEEAR